MDAAVVQLAAQVLHAIVVQHRSLVRAALRNMPPLPSLAVLKDVNAVLIQVCGDHRTFNDLRLAVFLGVLCCHAAAVKLHQRTVRKLELSSS